MNFLLDTNVISEVQRRNPEPKVMVWLDRIDEDRAFVSVVTIAEIRRGLVLLDDASRRASLESWLTDDLPARFGSRILPIDSVIAERWGDLMAHSKRTGVALSVLDGFLAATALARELTLVTRNTRDFAPFDVPLFNPWDSGI